MGRLDDRVVIVTGAGRGVGRAHALLMAEEGAKVVVNDLGQARDGTGAEDVSPAQQVVDEIAGMGGEAVANGDDVSDWDGAKRMIDQAVETFGGLDVVINNAGMGTGAQLMADDVVEKSKLEMDANFYGPMRMGVAFAPILKANGGGAIANVLSVAGLVNFPFAPTYSTSKAAGHSLTQGQRAVLAGQNTLVCGIYPGPIDTDMTAGMTVEKGSTEEVAVAVFEGLAQGTEEIFTDNMARGLAQGMKADAKAVEKSIAAQYQNVR